MASITILPARRLPSVAIGRWAASAAVLAACAAFLFISAKPLPIVLWDESRMAVNALEMHASGHLSLVTTYGGRPDLWNTKPPLLIWLMDVCMTLFGPSEWSLRLPSALAAMGTLALVMSFTRRVTHSFVTGVLAAGLLCLSFGFFGDHSVRTGDYEALLSFLTTAYLYVLFFALHRRRPRASSVLLAGGLVTLACMTKGIAGLLPGVGVPVYLLLCRRWARPFRWSYLSAAILAAVLVASFLVLREQAAPGYLRAMMFNDVLGRFGEALDQHDGAPWYYVYSLFTVGVFSVGLIGALSPLALVGARGPARLALLYTLCTVAGMVAVLSLSATKLCHYVTPALPLLSIATAIALKRGLDVARGAQLNGRISATTLLAVRALLAVALMLSAARSAYGRYVWAPVHNLNPQANYGELFAILTAQDRRSVIVADGGIVRPGVRADGVAQDYSPQLDFYRELASVRGMSVHRVSPGALAAQPQGTLLATCDPDLEPTLRPLGAPVAAPAQCLAVVRR